MTSLSFPDVNVWLALATPEHVHHVRARRWWDQEPGGIAFSRFTQLGFLRLMTTAAAMGGKPLSTAEAWVVYDRLFDDDRVTLVPEPAAVEPLFRKSSNTTAASPKIWTDAWLLALSRTANGTFVTFDRALASRGARCLLPTISIAE